MLVGDAGPYFTYERLNAAFRLLLDGAPLLAIARNRYFRRDEGLSLDMGPFVAALEYATGVEAELYGKPSPAFFREALEHLGHAPGETLMVGDDVESDVLGALDPGLHATLVRTGKYHRGDESGLGERAHVFDDFPAVVDCWTTGINPELNAARSPPCADRIYHLPGSRSRRTGRKYGINQLLQQYGRG